MYRPLFVLAVLSVVCVIVTSGNTINERFDGEVQEISPANSEASSRLRRAIRGFYKENSKKRSKYHRQSFSHRMSTDPEGGVSMDTKHHHEKGGMAEETNKRGSFGFGRHDNNNNNNNNLGDGSWFNEDEEF